MSRNKKDSIVTGVLAQDLAEPLGQAFRDSGHHLEAAKTIKKLSKVLESNNIDAILLDESSIEGDLLQTAKQVDEECPNSRIIVIPEGPCSTQSELFQYQGIDHIVPRGPTIDDTFMRIARSLGIRVLPPSEGKTKVMCEKLFKTTSSWSTFGKAFHIHEGIRMHHPQAQLKSRRSDDREVPFLKNGQINAYYFQDIPYFWMPDDDAVMNPLSQDLLQLPKKLVIHATAPPIQAAIDRERWYVGYSHFIMTPAEEWASLEEACILLNSRVYDFYINKIFTPLNVSGKSRSIMRSMDWRDLPFPKKCSQEHECLFEEELLEMELLLKSGAGYKHPRVAELYETFNQWAFDCFDLEEADIQLLRDLHF